MTTKIRDESAIRPSTPAVATPGPDGAPGPAGLGWDPAVLPAAPPAVEHFARQLSETAGALFMFASVGGVFAQVEPAAFKLYRDRLLLAAGNPDDPVEIMLLEQIALAHLNIGRLHLKSATAEGLEAAKAYGGMAIALTGEFRRIALAVAAYRASALQKKPPSAGVVQEGAGDVATVAPVLDQEARNSELGSNGEAGDGGSIPFEEPAPRRGRPAKRGEAEGAHPRRPRAAPRRRAG